MKIELVDGWRNAWRWISVQCMAISLALQGAYMLIPPKMQDAIPDGLLQYVAWGMLAVGFVGRFVQQTPPACPPEPPKDAP